MAVILSTPAMGVVVRSGNGQLDASVAAVVTIAVMDHPLRRYREKHDLSQAALAALLGTTKVTVSRLETGRRSASGDLLKRIADVTDGEVTPNDLLLVPHETTGAAA